jgi:diacylglycerol kinase (ATP)
MRVALLHNSSAGGEDHSADELAALIRSAGHEVVHSVGKLGDLTAALQEEPCDLVVIAGGDGTVGRTACELSGWEVPIAILPLGTANNTARSLDLPLRLKKLARSWSSAGKFPFDLGFLNDGAQRVRFAECAGWGVFAQAIHYAKQRNQKNSVKQALKSDRKMFRAAVASVAPRFYRISVDGRDCSGHYVLVEVMNVRFLGPQLSLSPGSSPSDGHLELVLAGDAERAALDQLAKTGEGDGRLRIERGRQIHVDADDALLHRDGQLVRHARGTRGFDLDVEPAAIHYLR